MRLRIGGWYRGSDGSLWVCVDVVDHGSHTYWCRYQCVQIQEAGGRPIGHGVHTRDLPAQFFYPDGRLGPRSLMNLIARAEPPADPTDAIEQLAGLAS